MKIKLAFLYLSAFHSQGGIEKFNRAFLHSLINLNPQANGFSFYDQNKQLNEHYFPLTNFNERKLNKGLTSLYFIWKLLISSPNVLFVGHLNLAPFCILLQKLLPKTRFILIAHGIEVWSNLNGSKHKFLQSVDEIWAVSNFTKSELIALKPNLHNKIKVFPNTLDPYFPKLDSKEIDNNFLQKYGVAKNEKVILTLSRLDSNEGYKGYDRVVESLPHLKCNAYKYIIAGKYDEEEKKRVEKIAKQLSVLDKVIFAGFVKDEDLISLYQSASVFVMPSFQEGFGIVFIEAMACGTPVIAGNIDGSVDALKNGELGTLINPKDTMQIAEVLNNHITVDSFKTLTAQKLRIQKVQATFGFSKFKNRMEQYLNELSIVDVRN